MKNEKIRENILTVQNLSAAYEETAVLYGVDLEVRKGEVLCIVGESGSGKSTLIRTICGDPRITVTEGSIRYRERVWTALKARERQKLLGTQIGLIQQNPWGAFNPIRRIDVQFQETFRSHGLAFDKEKLSEIFRILGLKDTEKLLKMRPYELSGGMNQRIAIAASFVLSPELLLCDEITSALDVTTAMAVTEQLLELKQTNGTTVVLVTHNLGLAKCIADRIVIMHQGCMVECGDTDTILRHPQSDHTRQLLRDVPKLER